MKEVGDKKSYVVEEFEGKKVKCLLLFPISFLIDKQERESEISVSFFFVIL